MKRNTIKQKFETKFNNAEFQIKAVPISGRDHYMYDIYCKEKKIGIFQISYSSKEFGSRLIGKMARQLGISSNQLKGVEKCTFYAQDFIEHSKLFD